MDGVSVRSAPSVAVRALLSDCGFDIGAARVLDVQRTEDARRDVTPLSEHDDGPTLRIRFEASRDLWTVEASALEARARRCGGADRDTVAAFGPVTPDRTPIEPAGAADTGEAKATSANLGLAIRALADVNRGPLSDRDADDLGREPGDVCVTLSAPAMPFAGASNTAPVSAEAVRRALGTGRA